MLTNPPIKQGKKPCIVYSSKHYIETNSNGELFVVIQKKQGMPSAKKKNE
ncbi:hypothetical protein ACVNP1_15570 [Staphylococcus aureus]